MKKRSSYSASVSDMTWDEDRGWRYPVGSRPGREPCASVEGVTECVEFAEAPFGGGGQIGLDNREVGESLEGAPASSGAALLHLDRPDGPFCFVHTVLVDARICRKE
jgi:hypothetical protein